MAGDIFLLCLCRHTKNISPAIIDSIDNYATRYEPSHRVCKPAYLVPVPGQDNWEDCVRKGIRRKNGGDGRSGGTN